MTTIDPTNTPVHMTIWGTREEIRFWMVTLAAIADVRQIAGPAPTGDQARSNPRKREYETEIVVTYQPPRKGGQ